MTARLARQRRVTATASIEAMARYSPTVRAGLKELEQFRAFEAVPTQGQTSHHCVPANRRPSPDSNEGSKSHR